MTVATLRTVADLKAAGLIAEAQAERLADVAAAYAIALPEAMARRIGPGDADPLRRQYVPSALAYALDKRFR